jgi:hypothetical protein
MTDALVVSAVRTAGGRGLRLLEITPDPRALSPAWGVGENVFRQCAQLLVGVHR